MEGGGRWMDELMDGLEMDGLEEMGWSGGWYGRGDLGLDGEGEESGMDFQGQGGKVYGIGVVVLWRFWE